MRHTFLLWPFIVHSGELRVSDPGLGMRFDREPKATRLPEMEKDGLFDSFLVRMSIWPSRVLLLFGP